MRQPSTKTARHGMIRRVLESSQVSSQSELRQILQDSGVNVTQATLSRDLVEMRATKVRTASGQQIYALTDQDASAFTDAGMPRLARWCQDLLVAVDSVAHQLLIRTPAGAAQLFAAALDTAGFEDVVGCVAGDDTLIVLCRSDEAAVEIRDSLLAMAESRPQANQRAGKRR